MRKVVVLGASANPTRFSYKAVLYLVQQKFEVIPVGLRKGDIGHLQIHTGNPEIEQVDTLLLYLNPDNQKKYYDYILAMHPGRIIFNPGTENFELAELAKAKGIHITFDCAINMLDAREF